MLQGGEDDREGGQRLCLDIASCKGERLRDGGEEGAEGKGSREIKDPPGSGGVDRLGQEKKTSPEAKK